MFRRQIYEQLWLVHTKNMRMTYMEEKFMNDLHLEVSQMLKEHPILGENEKYRLRYVNVLNYFVQKYSKDDLWAKKTLQLYYHKLVGRENSDQPLSYNLQKQSKRVLATRFKPFKFFTYRYCLIFDCIFMNAYMDKDKGEKIFVELSSIYHKRYQKKIRQVFDYLYDASVSVENIDKIDYMRQCWDKNRDFLKDKPIKVIVTANMSAGKSTLLNALVGKKVSKTQHEACTSKLHYIENKAFEDNLYYEYDYLLELDADYDTLMDDNVDNNSSEIQVGVSFRTIGAVPKRTWLIDTPGVNSSQNEDHRQLTENALSTSEADALIYLMNGESLGTEDERRHLLFVKQNYQGKIIFVVNKLDTFGKDDSVPDSLKQIASDLHEIGFDELNIVPISAYAAYLAKMAIFGEQLNEDEQDELAGMVRKMRKQEYQFDTYYPENIQKSVEIESSEESYQVLKHSGILHLENIIYNMR